MVQVCAMRVSRLAADGTTPAAASNMIVTDGLVSLAWEPEILSGEEIQVPNACGKNVVDYKDDDRIRRLNLTMGLAYPDVELLEMIANALLVTATGNSVGFALPLLNTAIAGNGVALELFSKAIVNGRQAVALPWWQTVLPITKNWRFEGGEFSNAAYTPSLVGIALENVGFGNGPDNGWTGPADRVLASKRVAAIPTVVCGYQATPAQV
jgi:hypothetical protein